MRNNRKPKPELSIPLRPVTRSDPGKPYSSHLVSADLILFVLFVVIRTLARDIDIVCKNQKNRPEKIEKRLVQKQMENL